MKDKPQKIFVITLLLFFSISIISQIQFSKADTYYIGGFTASSYGTGSLSSVESAYQVNHALNGLSIDTLTCAIAFPPALGTEHIKGLIIADNNSTIIAVSNNTYTTTGTGTWFNFYFTTPIQITNLNSTIVFGICTDGTGIGFGDNMATNGTQIYSYISTVNNYASPATLSGFNFNAVPYQLAFYATLKGTPTPTATPSPSPTPTPTPTPPTATTIYEHNITYSDLNSEYAANFPTTITGNWNFTVEEHGLDSGWVLFIRLCAPLDNGGEMINDQTKVTLTADDFQDNGYPNDDISYKSNHVYSDYPLNNTESGIAGYSPTPIYGVMNWNQTDNVLSCPDGAKRVVPNTYFWNSFRIENDGDPFTQGYVTVTMQQLTPVTVSYPTTHYYSITPTPTYSVYNSMTSAHINQSKPYLLTETVISGTEPYGTATYKVYKTSPVLSSSNNNSTRDYILQALGLLGTESLTLNKSGTFTLSGSGTFNFNIIQDYIFNSNCSYQGFKINGTITGTGEIFTEYVCIEALEPLTNQIIQAYITGGSLVNSPLVEISFNQLTYNTNYNVSGFVFMSGVLYTGGTELDVFTTQIATDPIFVRDLPFTDSEIVLTLTGGTFTFLITPQLYNSFPMYQGIQIFQPDLGISVNYYIEFIGTNNGTIFPTPYPTSSSSVINPTPVSSLDLTQFAVMFFLLFVPPLLLAAMCFEMADKTSLKISPILGFFLGLCVMVPIGYLTPYNGQPLVPLWMLFIFVAALFISGILIVKSMLNNGGVPT